MPRVSVVVPTKNGAQRLPDLFRGLREQTVKDFEVVVIDDGSTDNTAAVVEASGLGRVVRSPRSLGPGAASNLGVEHAAADVIAFTDDDTIPAPDWIERGLAAIEASASGLVAGHIELLLPEQPTVSAMMDYGRGYLNQEQYVVEGFGATANLWARRAVLQQLGGFDGDAAWQTHDRDFGERARMAGIRWSTRPTRSSRTRRATARASWPASRSGSAAAARGWVATASAPRATTRLSGAACATGSRGGRSGASSACSAAGSAPRAPSAFACASSSTAACSCRWSPGACGARFLTLAASAERWVVSSAAC